MRSFRIPTFLFLLAVLSPGSPAVRITCDQEVDNDREGLTRHTLPQVGSADWSNEPSMAAFDTVPLGQNGSLKFLFLVS